MKVGDVTQDYVTGSDMQWSIVQHPIQTAQRWQWPSARHFLDFGLDLKCRSLGRLPSGSRTSEVISSATSSLHEIFLVDLASAFYACEVDRNFFSFLSLENGIRILEACSDLG